jgi:hypothetical protein
MKKFPKTIFQTTCSIMIKECLAAALLCTGLLACKTETEKKDNGLAEVRLSDRVSNADIVRLPIDEKGVVDSNNMAAIRFFETEFNFGEVQQSALVKHDFKFKNSGKVPLIVTDIRTTCGCTVPEWTKSPIAPGAEDVVKVVFNTEGKEGFQEKKITIIANSLPAETELVVKGNVLVPAGKGEKKVQ